MHLPAAIRIGLAAVLLGLFGACTTVTADPRTGGNVINDGQDFSMVPGGQVNLQDHSTLRYVRIVNDSRCPPGVQCIWAGDAEVAFTWVPASGPLQSFSLHTGKDPKSQAIGARRLTLAALARGASPQAELRVDATP